MSEEQKIREESQEDGKSERPGEADSNILPEQIILSDEPSNQTSAIQKSENENMEVHHHPHVEKKNFKEYFLEFLMIFLAVTLGFFAENIRESLVNKEKVSHYIQNLVADLESDTTNLGSDINYTIVLSNMLDSALKIAPERLVDINTQDTFFHYIFLYYSLVPGFAPSTNTISQLKTGGFNIMSNQSTIDSINFYYQVADGSVSASKFNVSNYYDVARKMQAMMQLPEPAASDRDTSVSVILLNRRIFLTTDPIAITQFYNVLGNSQGSFKTSIQIEKFALAKATALIMYLKKEYKMH
jgi:hypothetical protein